jgi:hypothetical protein
MVKTSRITFLLLTIVEGRSCTMPRSSTSSIETWPGILRNGVADQYTETVLMELGLAMNRMCFVSTVASVGGHL